MMRPSVVEPHFVKAGAEVIEKSVIDFSTCQHLLVIPHGFLVGNVSDITDAKKFAKTGAVDNLILYLMVAQTVVTLKKQHLEHQYAVERWTTRFALALSCKQS